MQNEPLTLETDKLTTLIIAACVAAAAALAGEDIDEIVEAKKLMQERGLTESLLLQLGDALSSSAMPGNEIVHIHAVYSPPPPTDRQARMIQ